MLKWQDGIEMCPGGKAREVPQRWLWANSLWVTREGECYRKHYNGITHRWKWDREMLELVEEESTGRVGLHIPHFVEINVIICMAWRRRVPHSPTFVHVIPGKDPVAKYLRWEEEEKEEDSRYAGEVWQSLKYKCGLVKCDTRYKISNHGRLKNPEGDVTSGHSCWGYMWGAVKGCGLVNLTQAVSKEIIIPEHILDATHMMMGDKYSPYEHSLEKGVQEQTSWQYFNKAAQFIEPKSDLRHVVQTLVDRNLWGVLIRMKARRDPVMGGPLKPLMGEVVDEYPEFAHDPFAYDQLRLARLSLLS